MPQFSIIVPVYNRIDEVDDLLKSLASQSTKDFEVIIVEDGSTQRCDEVVNNYIGELSIQYYHKSNEGRSIARNYGLERANGDYFIFFDSDCVIPKDYFKILQDELASNYTDCFGGPDAAHDSFSDIQKAINYSMTSFLTTGGIRGGKVNLEKFVPRTFNMGFSRRVYEEGCGFREMFSEDIDMSTRILQAGFNISLINSVFVYHKRRVNIKLFARQIYIFGMSRITLYLLYPKSLKMVHLLPSCFLLAVLAMIILSAIWKWITILPLVLYIILLFITALVSTKRLKIALLSVLTSIVQLSGYGLGFLKAFVVKILFKRGRNVDEEILIRKGK